MKEVTIDNVRERISVLSNGRISLREEFELACLRQLLTTLEAKPVVYSLIFRNMEGKLYNYVNVNTTFATLEEAQAYGKGGRYVTQGDGSIKWVADPSLDPVVVPLYTAPPVQVNSVDDDVRSVVALLENNEWADHCTKTVLGSRLESEITRLYNWRSAQPAPVITDDRLLQNLETRINSLEIGERKGALSTQQETSLKAYRLAVQCLRSSATSDENATDNTAQQFEALAGRVESDPVAVVKHYTGEKYPTLKFAQDEWFIIGNRDNAQELADAINALTTSAGGGKQ